MAVMIGIRIALWKKSASSPIGVTCGWKPMVPSVGWPTVASGAVRAGLLDSTLALDGASPGLGWAHLLRLRGRGLGVGADRIPRGLCRRGGRGRSGGGRSGRPGAGAGAACERAAAGASAKAAAARMSLSGVFI